MVARVKSRRIRLRSLSCSQLIRRGARELIWQITAVFSPLRTTLSFKSIKTKKALTNLLPHLLKVSSHQGVGFSSHKVESLWSQV